MIPRQKPPWIPLSWNPKSKIKIQQATIWAYDRIIPFVQLLAEYPDQPDPSNGKFKGHALIFNLDVENRRVIDVPETKVMLYGKAGAGFDKEFGIHSGKEFIITENKLYMRATSSEITGHKRGAGYSIQRGCKKVYLIIELLHTPAMIEELQDIVSKNLDN